MARATFWLLVGTVAVACALPDVNIVASLGGEAGTGGRGAGAPASGGSTSKGASGDQPLGGRSGDAGGAGEDALAGAGSESVGTGGLVGGASGAGAAGGWGRGGESSSVCGDGTREADEACDDGNALACGTCSEDCQRATPLAAARGSLHVEAGSVEDAEEFTLDDGFGAVTFEFAEDFVGSPPERVVAFDAATTTRQLRDSIVAVINDPPNGLAITAEAGVGDGDIVLTNDRYWSGGNRAITDRVSGVGFTHTGMSGGAGHDCLDGTGCLLNGVCASMTCGGGGFCVAP